MLKLHFNLIFIPLYFLVFTRIIASNDQFPVYEKTWEDSVFFNTQFLGSSTRVTKHLVKYHNFEESSFITPDGLKLECLVRKVENPLFTIVVSAGFFPGLMTGMATLVQILPKNCTIIFYNNRGKGKSEGHWLPILWNHGTHEYKDVIGALNYAKMLHPKTPIIKYGTCAGTFSLTKAVCNLYEQKELHKYNIKGLILDSTVTELPATIERIPDYVCKPGLVGFLKRVFLWSLRYTIFLRNFMTSGDASRLDPKILASTNIPTLHINCEVGDPLTPYCATNDFYQRHLKHMQDKNVCEEHIFKNSQHALHTLLHKNTYAAILAKFIMNKALA